MKKILIELSSVVSVAFLLFFSSGCGDPSVDLTNVSYNPKIVVEGYLYCGEPVKNIKLMRNYALNTPIGGDINLTPSGNKVSVYINGTALYYDSTAKSYYNNQIMVGYGQTYKLEVSAEIDGKKLHATSTTTTPLAGFSIIDKNPGTVKYASNVAQIKFRTSAGTDFYAFSFIPDSAGAGNFIYDNPFAPNLSSSDITDHLNNYKFQYEVLTNLSAKNGDVYNYIAHNFDFWFYSSYTITAYAGDSNFRYYSITATNVQEFDGNFHEPIEIFQGDGIGVFASAIKEVLRITVIK